MSNRLLFSAVAVLAFNGVAMANSQEGKLVSVFEENNAIALVQATPCQDLAIDIYESKIGNGPDDLTFLNALMAMCHLD